VSHQDRRAELVAALAEVERRLTTACAAAGRPRDDVRLIAVTKNRPATDVALLRELGVLDVGESKDQEAAAKAADLADPSLRWHFVGRLQRNKARSVASYADVVHAVDRAALVAALSAGALRAGRALDVLLQVSLDGDPDRAGASPGDLRALADAVAHAPGLRLAGLMAVAPLGVPPGPAFARLAVLSGQVRTDHPAATWISAGMSADLEDAVAHGATHVRVGTALLGQRPPVSR
jgi:pyridoxal phosphate enzyme (YggS family)